MVCLIVIEANKFLLTQIWGGVWVVVSLAFVSLFLSLKSFVLLLSLFAQ